MAMFFNNPGFFHIGQKIITAVDTKTQLQCRLVCKTWKDFLEDPLLNFENLKRMVRKRQLGMMYSLESWAIHQDRLKISLI